jgi:hypothetical protein
MMPYVFRQFDFEGVDAILFRKHPFCFGDSKRRPTNKHQTNTPLLAERNILICTNRFCTNINQYSINTVDLSNKKLEFCPDCKKRLGKSISQEEPQFVLTGDFTLAKGGSKSL